MTEASHGRAAPGSVRVLSEGTSLAALDGALSFVVEAAHRGIGDIEVPGTGFLRLDVDRDAIRQLIRVPEIARDPFDVLLDLSDLVEPVLDISTGASVYGVVRTWLGVESARSVQVAARSNLEMWSTGHGGLRAVRRNDTSPIALQRYDDGSEGKADEKFIPERSFEAVVRGWLHQTRNSASTSLTYDRAEGAGRTAYTFELWNGHHDE